MNGSELAQKQAEALEQVAYLKKIVEQTRLQAGYGYPHFLLWGFIWIIGDIAGTFVKDWEYGLVWLVLCLAGVITSFIIGFVTRSGTKNSPTILRQLTFLSLVMAVAAGLCFPMWFHFLNVPIGVKLLSAYPFFWVGVIYVANGIFIGRPMVWIGSWIILETLVSLAIPLPYFYYWEALAGGGSFLATGFIFMKQVKSHG
jgi:hypothetical protein